MERYAVALGVKPPNPRAQGKLGYFRLTFKFKSIVGTNARGRLRSRLRSRSQGRRGD